MTLFNKAKAKAGSEPAKKKDHPEFILENLSDYSDLSRLAVLNAQKSDLEAEIKTLTAGIKEKCIDAFTQLYANLKRNPGSFFFRAKHPKKGDAASLMFIPTDNYIKLGEERAQDLKDTYGDSIVSEETTWIMDSELVEKHGDVISRLIEKCKDIPAADKEKLISAKVAYKVKKGTIEELYSQYGMENAPEILKMVYDVQPIFQMKNIKEDKPTKE